jgi:hypothetical protein
MGSGLFRELLVVDAQVTVKIMQLDVAKAGPLPVHIPASWFATVRKNLNNGGDSAFCIAASMQFSMFLAKPY